MENIYEIAKKEFNEYKVIKNKTEELKDSIVKKAKNIYKSYPCQKNTNLIHQHITMWMIAFESDQSMIHKFLLLKSEVLAQKYLQEYIYDGTNHSVLINTITQSAFIDIENQQDTLWCEDKEKIWINVFKDIPEFFPALEQTKNHWKNHRANYLKEHLATYSLIKKPTVEHFFIKIPINYFESINDKKTPIKIDRVKNKVQNALKDVLENIVKEFNKFELQSYIEDSSVNEINLQVENQDWLFNIKTNKHTNLVVREEIERSLIEQLHQGWCDLITCRKHLLDTRELQISFDCTHSTVIESNLNREP